MVASSHTTYQRFKSPLRVVVGFLFRSRERLKSKLLEKEELLRETNQLRRASEERERELQKQVENVCVDNGFEAEQRKFIPHITIGRVKSSFNHKKDTNNYGFNKFYVNNVAIVESEISSKGSRYKNLDVFDLQ